MFLFGWIHTTLLTPQSVASFSPVYVWHCIGEGIKKHIFFSSKCPIHFHKKIFSWVKAKWTKPKWICTWSDWSDMKNICFHCYIWLGRRWGCTMWGWSIIRRWSGICIVRAGGQICENERMYLYWICKGRMDSRMLITKVLIACSGVRDLQVLRIEELNNGRRRKRYCSNTWSFPAESFPQFWWHV